MTDPSLPDPARVDDLLGQGIPFRKFRKHFPNRTAALQAYADYHAALHAFPPADTCCLCKGPADVRAQYAFQAHITGGFQISNTAAPPPVQFWTFASFCNACHRRARLKRGLANVVQFFVFFIVLCGGLAAAMGFPGTFYALGTGAPGTERTFYLLSAVTAVILLGSAYALSRWVRLLGLPPALRDIRRPFRFLNVCRETSPGKFPRGPTAT